MRRPFQILFLIVFFLTGLFFVVQIHAEDKVVNASVQCIEDFQRCKKQESSKKNNCEPVADSAGQPRSQTWSHRIRMDLSNYKFPANTNLYIAECLPVTENGSAKTVCTTGDHATDRLIVCGNANNTSPDCDPLQKLIDLEQYSINQKTQGIYYFDGTNYVKQATQTLHTNAQGIPSVTKLEWESRSSGNIEHSFQVWSLNPPTPTPAPSGTVGITPGLGAQQQGVLSFSGGAIAPEIKPCNGDVYDPSGFVFDTKSLEPIPDAQVAISMKKPDGTFDTAYASEQSHLSSNPFRTGTNGEYVYFVVEGDYKLAPTKTGYTHPALSTQSQLNPNTNFIYSQLYFNDSPDILERGSLEHRDIPLVPADGIGKTYDLQPLIEEHSVTVDGKLEYKGQLTHPFAHVIIQTCKIENATKTCTNKKIYDNTNGGPDKYGKYDIFLDQRILQPGEFYDRSYEKSDLTTLKLGFNPFLKIYQWLMSSIKPTIVYAAESDTVAINPIPTYIEGFAYDANGNLMPNANVQIFIPLTKLPVYRTTADEKGYFKITSEFLPKMEYSIGYAPSGSNTSNTQITTSQFLSENKEFITSEKINTYLITTAANDPRRTVTPTYVPSQKITAAGTKVNEPTPVATGVTEQTQAPQTMNNSFLLIGAILLLLIATVGTLLGVYLYKKKMQEQTPQV